VILFDLDKLQAKINKLENEIIQPDFWNDSKSSTKILQESKILKNKYLLYENLEKKLSNLEEMNTLLLEEYDAEMCN